MDSALGGQSLATDDGFAALLSAAWAAPSTMAADLVAYLSFDPALLATPDMLARAFLQVLLLFGSAFFSGSETALFSLSRLGHRYRHPDGVGPDG